MPTIRLSAKAIQAAKPPAAGRIELWDSVISDDVTLPGSLGLRVTAAGSKSWVLMFRVGGAQRRMTIGRYPAYSLAQARTEARAALVEAGKGIDPVRAAAESRTVTTRAASETFIERYAKVHQRTWRETERVLETYLLPRVGDKPVGEVTHTDIHAVLDALMDAGHPYMANRALATIRKFYNWCLERRLVSETPTAGIRKPGKEVARDRILDDDELAAVWQATAALGQPFGPIYQLLILTGQRREEVARMRWEQLDLEAGLWTLPKEEVKSDRLHVIPLADAAVEILKPLARNGPYVFTTTGKTPPSGFAKAKRRLDEISETGGWRTHDLRRTAASGMARLGIAPHVIEKVLNHSTGQISGVAAIYNRHAYLPEKTHALETWARAVETIVSGAPADNVVAFAAR